MGKLSFNRSLAGLAFIGILLYVAVVLLSQDKDEADAGQPYDVPAISKQAAAEAAVAFLQKEYGAGGTLDTFVTYQTHKSFSGYLQKADLTDAYEKNWIRAFPLDYFEVEAADAEKTQRYYVRVNFTDGSIAGWSRGTEVEAERTGAASGDGKRAAERALVKQGYDAADFRFVRQSAADGAYVYESLTKKIGESALQISIAVTDGAITRFDPQFTVPASYQRWQDEQDDSASLMTRISLGFTLLMTLFAAYAVVKYRKYVTFRHGVLLTLAFAAIYCINNINMYPAFKTGYGDRLDGWASVSTLFLMNFIVFLMAASQYVSLLAGREMWLGRGWNAWPHVTEPAFGREVMKGMGRGYLLCLFILGVQQMMFYVAEHYFHVWAVNDPSDSIYNMLAPGLFPLMAWAAALSEEAAYRLFGIVLLLRVVRIRFLAVLLPSMIWALSHTQYPIYPVYTRFVEVTVIGVIFGYAFLRYGFITVVFAHASMDSILMGLSLIDAADVPDIAAGIFYIFVPGLVAYAIAWFHRKHITPGPPGSPQGSRPPDYPQPPSPPDPREALV